MLSISLIRATVLQYASPCREQSIISSAYYCDIFKKFLPRRKNLLTVNSASGYIAVMETRTTKLLSAQQIQNELTAIEGGGWRSWGRISILLDAIEATGYWASSADSFTAWVKKNSRIFGVKDRLLWRYLTAGRFYNQIRSEFSWDVPLESAAEEISAENLEILAKISRVAPKAIREDLTREVLKGKIKRNTLRAVWHSFRPVLEGRTARGSRTDHKWINENDSAQKKKLSQAVNLNTLLKVAPSWAGQLSFYRYFINYDLRTDGEVEKEADAILLSEDKEGDIAFHGIEVSRVLTWDFLRRKLKPLEMVCDFVWVAVPTHTPPEEVKVPDYIGILWVDDIFVTRIRPAQRIKIAAQHSGTLARKLLVTVLKG